MKLLSNTYSLAVLLALPSLCLGAENVFLTSAPDGSTMARNASGVLLWRSYKGGSGTAARAAALAGAIPSSETVPAWDPLTDLYSCAPCDMIAGPIFDSLGNAWVVANSPTNLVAIQSNGVSGTWQAPQIIGPSLAASTETVGLAVDQAGGVYVTYGAGLLEGGAYLLMWTKYTPASGWQTPAVIYTSSSFFTETFAEIDSVGRLVVVFNPDYGLLSIATNPSQSAWGSVQTIAPGTIAKNDEPILPSVAANPSGTRLALVYLLLDSVVRRGLRYTFFDSTTGEWSAPEVVPDSANAYFVSYSTLDAFPMAVDDSGNITLAALLSSTAIIRLSTQWSIGGFRYENGAWSMQQLIPFSGSEPSLESFGSTALNANGTVLIAVPLSNGGSGVNVTVFRYTPGTGWDTEIAASYNTSTASRCKVAWFEGTEALVVYNEGVYGELAPFVAALYANGAWGSAPPIPGDFTNIDFPALAGAPSGEVLLGVPQNEAYVTFLRP